MDNQLEAYYATIQGAVRPYGVIDPYGRFYKAGEKKITSEVHSYRWGIYLDDTDDRRDPRVGYRFQYEKWGVQATRKENSAFFQEDFSFTIFVPLLFEKKGVFVLNRFYSSSNVENIGAVDQTNYTCDNVLYPGCQAVFDELYRRQVVEAENGKATSLGGSNRLRGYRTNRFFDSFTDFVGIEFRWYLFESQHAFDYFVEKGVLAGLQLAFFLEKGTVAPTRARLWEESRHSSGIGARSIFNTVVLRFDVGFSDEGSETTFFVGYPF